MGGLEENFYYYIFFIGVQVLFYGPSPRMRAHSLMSINISSSPGLSGITRTSESALTLRQCESVIGGNQSNPNTEK